MPVDPRNASWLSLDGAAELLLGRPANQGEELQISCSLALTYNLPGMPESAATEGPVTIFKKARSGWF